MKDYFPNRTGECFSSSVANLLMHQYGDIETANSFFNKAPKHSLTTNDGETLICTWPYLVDDLTNGKYTGTLSINTSAEKILNMRGEIENISPKEYKEAVRYSLDAGRIFLDGLVFQTAPMLISMITGPGNGHVVVYLGQDHLGNEHYIDNGNINTKSLEGHTIVGFFKVDQQ